MKTFGMSLLLLLSASACAPITPIDDGVGETSAEVKAQCPAMTADLDAIQKILKTVDVRAADPIDKRALSAWLDARSELSFDDTMRVPAYEDAPSDSAELFATQLADTFASYGMRNAVRPHGYSFPPGCSRGMSMLDYQYAVPEGSKLTRIRVTVSVYKRKIESMSISAFQPINEID